MRLRVTSKEYLCAILIVLIHLAGCATTTPWMKTRYQPMHPANNTSVDFRVEASDKHGMSKVQLYIYEYELYTNYNNNGVQSARKRAGGVWGLVKTWDYPAKPTFIDETHTVPGFPSSSYIKYLFRVRDSKGSKNSEKWSFAAGDWPFGTNPIPILANGEPAKRIDVAFVADKDDYANARGMLKDLESLVFDGYHTNNAVRRGKGYWQFYYSPETGSITDYDDSPRAMNIPLSVTNSMIIDHAAVIHTTIKRDWASGANFGTEPTNIGTAVHESGHAVFGLSDEYKNGGHWTSSDRYHNVYDTKGDCEHYNSTKGWPSADCEDIGDGWWRAEPTSLKCIMLDDGDSTMPDFERSCINRAVWIYTQFIE